MPDSFIIEREDPTTRAVILRIKGTLDAKNSPVLTRACAQVAEEGRHLVLCLSEVDFIASSGVGALLAIAEDFQESKLEVRFAQLSTAVSSVIELLNLDQFLKIIPTPDEALTDLAA